ncbi:MAG: hypothetical protein H6Q71_1632, partial [Firmicutes bacterium]|nr:hypothetical protein [Bacillota bacterium]
QAIHYNNNIKDGKKVVPDKISMIIRNSLWNYRNLTKLFGRCTMNMKRKAP